MSGDLRVDVAVVGAGGGGAVLGLALARRGLRAAVFEQATGPPGGLRGEILQPNGQDILDRLGLLQRLPATSVNPVRLFHFKRSRAGRAETLCTIDYGTLPPPYNRALITLPNVAHHAILDALEQEAPGTLRYKARFKRLRKDGERVVGMEVDVDGKPMFVDASLVVGADGGLSAVRQALGLPARIHRYREAYLIALFDSPHDVADAHYYVGRGTILGVFPAAPRKLYAFYMIPADSMSALKAHGLDALRASWRGIAPEFTAAIDTLRSWDQTAYMPTGRVRMPRWVTDGAALIGDAAHAMNPHASQGRMQAMADAMTLAEVAADCAKRGDWSAEALLAYEHARRPQVEMLQRMADEQVVFWNTGNPVLGYLRDRVFRTLGRNARLRQQVLAVTAGLRTQPAFTMHDRLIAAGLLPNR